MTNPPLTEAVYYILLSLTEPLHGYGIMQKAEQLSSGRVRLAAGTLYGALNTLLETVSYTHLDVYKRQRCRRPGPRGPGAPSRWRRRKALSRCRR